MAQAKASKSPARPPLTRGRIWAFRLVALSILPVVLVVVELALRLAGYGYETGFFKTITIGGEKYFVQNDNFALRFFPKESSRSPGIIRMPVHKTPGTLRVFIFGESAAMGDPEPSYGPARYMEVLLREKYPETKFEIINVAFTAINSHVILPIARECARHDGDIWIIYMGNNEMVGPFGAATVFGAQAPPLVYARLVSVIQKTRVGQLLTETSRKIKSGSAKTTSWGGMQMFLNNRVTPDSPLKDSVYRNFSANLNDILRAGIDAHQKIILNTVGVNLKDSPPFASMVNSNSPPQNIADFEDAMRRAESVEAQVGSSNALLEYEKAVKLQPQSAEAQFRLGECLAGLGQLDSAREHLQLACDTDALPFRTDSKINDTIRAAAKTHGTEGVSLLDAAALLASENPDKICGSETFYEHVHFNFDGAYHLGSLWAEQVSKLMPAGGGTSWPTQVECNQLLGLSDWNRPIVLEHMIGRLQVPPFTGQSNNAERIERLRSAVAFFHSRTNVENEILARENYVKQLARWPDDWSLHENYALFLQITGHMPEVIAEWRRVHELVPHDYLPEFQLGRMLGAQGQFKEAEEDLRASLKIRPSLTESWVEFGNVLATQQKFTEALKAYTEAVRQRPNDAQTLFRIAKIHVALNQHPEAVQFYRLAISANPAHWEAHYDLGGELDAAGSLAEATEEFSQAVRFNPNYSRGHYNYGILLAKTGRLEESTHEFEETLRLEPGYANAVDSLAKIRLLKAGKKKE